LPSCLSTTLSYVNMKVILEKSIKLYLKVSLIVFFIGILFGAIGIIFNFRDLFDEKAIDEKYGYFINKSGKSEDAIIADSEEEGKYIVEWYENKMRGTEKYVGTQNFIIIRNSIKVEVLKYIGPDSNLVKIRATFEHGKSFDKRIIGYASPLTLHNESFQKK
jgi:hypothetical protein